VRRRVREAPIVERSEREELEAERRSDDLIHGHAGGLDRDAQILRP
jgi:hypothetical protein